LPDFIGRILFFSIDVPPLVLFYSYYSKLPANFLADFPANVRKKAHHTTIVQLILYNKIPEFVNIFFKKITIQSHIRNPLRSE
jgi:hypothetical protein